MLTLPQVLLPPRPAVRLPSAAVEIPPPPPMPVAPVGSLLYQVAPVVLTAAGMGIILLVGNLQGGGGTFAILLLGTLLLVGGGAVVTILMHRSQSRAYRRGCRERIELYYDLLTNTRDRLVELLEEQRRVLLDKDPDPSACARLTSERASRLWERSPDDRDFLVLRAGLGVQPSSVPVSAPAQPNPFAPDPLIQAATQLAEWGRSVWGVPVGLRLVDGASAGVCGPRHTVAETLRALLIQLATHHAPDEVKLVALLPRADFDQWTWLRWLPHTWSDDRHERYLASTPAEASALSKRIEELLGPREALRSRYTAAAESKPNLPMYVIAVVDPMLADHMPVLARIMNQDQDVPLGTSCLFVAADRTRLPRACRTILQLDDDEPTARLQRGDGELQVIQVLDAAPLALAEQVASSLAPLRPRRLASASGLPPQVPLLSLFGVDSVEDLDVAQRWRRGAPERSLAVLIGVRPGGEPVMLDLHQLADGPHGLVAGSTGSGKSVLLQALLLGLAATYHPHEVAMVLVDYKGGSTAGPVRELPHVLGTITNLDGNLARRALVAIQAEIERRQALLSSKGCDDLDAYLARRRTDRALEPLPHLVLVVDEFAELKTERPEFIHQLIRTARVGRNVGFHLILATQKPRPAVDDEIWANTRFRICLRVEQPQDSQDVLKRPDAATLAGRGQAYLQVGHDETFALFQAAWSGAPYRPDLSGADPHELLRVDLDGTRHALGRAPDSPNGRHEPTHADVLARHLRAVASQESIEGLPKVWLPPLADQLSLEDVLEGTTGWDGRTWWRRTERAVEPVLGLVDDPAHRVQRPLRIDLPRSGNLAIFGAPGAGKTTALVTVSVALAREHAPDDVHLYLIDFGGHALSSLAALPHVGGVVLADEEEKLERVLKHLVAELGRRKAAFGEVGVSTLAAYRAASGARLPAVVVLVDNLPALLQAYPEVEDQVAQLAQQGGTLGVHLVMTAASPTLVRLRIANSLTQAIALRLADRADYGAVLSLPQDYEPPSIPGRGLVKGRPTLECQLAVPAPGATEADQTAAVRRLAHAMNEAWSGERPWRVRTLPEHVSLLDLLPAKPRRDRVPIAPVGIAEDELDPVLVDLRDGPHFAIAGPPRGGKSTLLRAWLISLAASMPPDALEIFFADFGRDAGATVPPGAHLIQRGAALHAALDALESPGRADLTRVLAIDDLEGLQRATDPETLQRLIRLVQQGRSGMHVLLAGSSATFGPAYDGLGYLVKSTQTGFLVGGSDYEDLQVFGINVPHVEASQGLPPGRGFYARRKRYLRLKIAEPPARLDVWSTPGEREVKPPRPRRGSRRR